MKKKSKLIIAIVCVAVILLLVVASRFLPQKDEAELPEEIVETTEETTEAEPETEEEPEETTEPEETGPQILEVLQEPYAENSDLAGWIQIPDTMINYPVMYTPDDGEKYIYADFEGNFDVGGLPFIEDGCSLDPESDNLIIYGHNMKNGSMFADLMKYTDRSFWEAHPTIHFATLYEARTYEIIAAFYDRVYYKSEDCFKFYQFIDAETEEDFNEAMTYYQENSLYDTGVTATYGDNLITLVTCTYHVENGRFVVVAREAPTDG